MNELRHVAIVPDGNRRWARGKGKTTLEGHRIGVETMEKILKKCFDLGIQQVSFWALSTENLKRSEDEVGYLFKLFNNYLNRFFSEFGKDDYKASIKFHGDLVKLPKKLLENIRKIEEQTKGQGERKLNVMIAYGGRFELQEAFKKILKSGEKDISEDLIRRNLFVKDDVDLVIRTGMRRRLSGLMPFQTAYSELYFTDTLWPDFTVEELEKAVEWFYSVKRNFGK
jgi:undecaprenyl diphosphate synthase